jgi:hypothetical protein
MFLPCSSALAVLLAHWNWIPTLIWSNLSVRFLDRHFLSLMMALLLCQEVRSVTFTDFGLISQFLLPGELALGFV